MDKCSSGDHKSTRMLSACVCECVSGIVHSCSPTRLQQLPVITSNTIVRCRSCRTYINPFVTFLDQRRWKCNLCYRVNDGRHPV